MSVRLVLPESVEAELRAALLAAPLESGAALLLGIAQVDGGFALLARSVIRAPPDGFRLQEADRWAPTTAWLSRLAGLADAENAGVALVHSHPMGGPANRSEADEWADELIAPFFVSNLDGRPFASLVLTRDGIGGHAWLSGGDRPVSEVRIPGRVLRRNGTSWNDTADFQPLHHRHLLIFGSEGQRSLERLSVAVVGLGGTGSAVSEQLVRMGVGEVHAIDFDVIEASNVSRVYGTRTSDIGAPKVEVAAKYLRAIGSKTQVVPLNGDIREKSIALHVVRHADVVFGCTDSHSSRAVLNDIAYQYMLPAIDMGVRVGMGDHGPTSAAIEIRVLRPDLPCLWCTGAIDGRRVAQELMPPERRDALAREGYVQGGAPAATIIPYTSLAAAYSVSRFLSMATGISEYEPGTFTFDALSFDSWTSAGSSRNECVCRSRLGLGDTRPVWVI